MGQQKLTRIHSLDSLRGAAAFIVVLYHLSLVLPAGSLSFDHNVPFIFSNPWSWIYQTPFLNGPGSVLIFFVLSGLVLALPFFGRDDQRYLPFLIKRVMRIWPPFAAAIIASALLQWLAISRGDANASTLFYANWTIPPTIGVVAQHLDLTQLFVRPINELDNPMWSLVHELRISLIFPLIVFCTFRRPLLSFIGSIGLVFVAAVLIGGRHRELISEIASTIGYIWLFAAGAAIAANLGRVRVAIDGLSSVGTAMMWIFGFSLLAFASSGIQDVDSVPRAFFLLAAGFGAIVVILLCTTENIVTRMLETPIPRWLGKVSYSLYLIHVPVLLAVFHLFPSYSYLLDAGLSLAMALVAAEIMHRTVEVPSMAAGRIMARRMIWSTTTRHNPKAPALRVPSD